MPAYVNGAYSVVALAPSPNPATSTSMTLSVGDGVLFPDPASVGPYDISIWPSGAVYRGGSGSGHGEICTVTAKSVDTLTIVRGAQSSTARVVIAGDQVAYTVSAGIFANFTLLNGQAGGQELFGGIAASENLVLRSTTHATKGAIYLGTPGNDFSFNEITGRLIGDRTFNGSTVNSSPIYIIERGTADPRLGFEVSGVTAWETGIDNSDDDAYKIQNSTGFGDYNSTQGYLRIDRNGAVLINGQTNGISSLEIGQDVASTYARLRMRGRYAGASGTGLWDVEALNDQIYLYDRTNGAFRFLIFTNGVVEIPGSLSVGAGASPFTGLDVETGVGATYGKFGPSLPVYIVAGNPNLGLNAYYNGGWKFGKGSTSHHAGIMTLDPSGGTLQFFVSSAPGAANGAISFSSPLILTATHAALPLLTSTSVLATDSSGNIVAGALVSDPNIIEVPSGCSAATFQAAIDALGSLGGIIIVPPGTYDLSATPLNLPAKNVWIRGSGKGNTVIKATSTATCLFRFNTGITWTQTLINLTSIKFSDITFEANSATNQDLLLISALFSQPPRITLRVEDCEFKFYDHTTNHSTNMVHLLNLTGARFDRCEWDLSFADMTSATGGHAADYGLGVWIDGSTGASFVQDVKFTDCAWYFQSAVIAAASGGGDVEGVFFLNCHVVGQGLLAYDANNTRHFGIACSNITDFQWIGGENTGCTGHNFSFDGGGPYSIDRCHMTNNRPAGNDPSGVGPGADGTPMILVGNSPTNTVIMFHHISSTQDGGYTGMLTTIINPSGTWGFFGTFSDNYCWPTGGSVVGDPGSGAGASSFVKYHDNIRAPSTLVASGAP